MCRMTDFGIRWKSEIGASGRWLVCDRSGGPRYVQIFEWADVKIYSWLLPLYAINVRLKEEPLA